jgi:hypothetical protein
MGLFVESPIKGHLTMGLFAKSPIEPGFLRGYYFQFIFYLIKNDFGRINPNLNRISFETSRGPVNYF